MVAVLALASPAMSSSRGPTERVLADREVGTPGAELAGGSSPTLFYFGSTLGGEPEDFAALGFSVTVADTVADLQLTNLLNFDVLILGFVHPDDTRLGPYQPDIEQYVLVGHGLLIHQPNAPGVIRYAPTGFELEIESQWWCGVPGGGASTETEVVFPDHPAIAGLPPDQVGCDADQVAWIGPAYALLTRNLECLDPAMAAGTFGLGRVVFETGNVKCGCEEYWIQVLNWLGLTGPVSVKSQSWGVTKAQYRW
jgi:hypothetical protein